MTHPNPSPTHPRDESTTPPTPSYRGGVGVGGSEHHSPRGGVTNLDELFEGLVGQRIPGGCDDCNAYQTVTRHLCIHVINIHHDDTCPTWRQHHAKRTPTKGE